jgi:hypothetical protein
VGEQSWEAWTIVLIIWIGIAAFLFCWMEPFLNTLIEPSTAILLTTSLTAILYSVTLLTILPALNKVFLKSDCEASDQECDISASEPENEP